MKSTSKKLTNRTIHIPGKGVISLKDAWLNRYISSEYYLTKLNKKGR